MYKIIEFPGVDDQGNPLVHALLGDTETGLVKHASGGLHPEIESYIRRIKQDPRYVYALINALGAGEYYGCFPAGSPVTTAQGVVPIEELREGASVLTHKNRYRKVLATQVHNRADEMTSIRVSGMPSTHPALQATPKHEVYVVRRDVLRKARTKHYYGRAPGVSKSDGIRRMLSNVTFDWVPIGDLVPGDYVTQPFPLGSSVDTLSHWASDDAAFLFGLYTAEGCLVHRYDRGPETRCGVVFVIGITEQETCARVIRIADEHGHTPCVTRSPETNSIRIELSWKELACVLGDHVGSHAVSKRLSHDVLSMPERWQGAFLTAYSDGDGHSQSAGKEKGKLRLVTASAGLAGDLRVLAARLGFLASISGRYNRKATWFNGNPIFEVGISTKQFDEEGRRTGGGPEGYLHDAGYILAPVREVSTESWSAPVYNLHVAEDNSYVVNNCAVHNSNINGDYFEESQLKAHADDLVGKMLYPDAGEASWGYKTFYDAGIYRHHKNKDKKRSMGEAVCAVWNPTMHRVELIVRVDRALAQEFGHDDLVTSLLNGEHPAVSMGCRVKYDVCSICGHKSKTRDDYCIHARTMMGQVLADGRKVYVKNPRPRFFDLSFVVIGADRTSFAMMKVAHVMRRSSDLGADELGSLKYAHLRASIRTKLAARKLATVKTSEIRKRLQALSAKTVPRLEASDPDIAPGLLDALGRHRTQRVLTTAASGGVVLKPKEFQRIILVSVGRKPLADRLEGAGRVFSPCDHVDRSVRVGDPSDYYPVISKLLEKVIGERSAFDKPLSSRIMVIRGSGRGKTLSGKVGLTKSAATCHLTRNEEALLDTISAGYNGYREQLLEKIGSIVSLITVREPGLLSALDIPVFGDTLGGMSKEAAPSLPLQLLGALPMAYLYGAHVRKGANAGEQPGPIDRFVEGHPILATSILLGLARLGMGASKSGAIERLIASVAK